MITINQKVVDELEARRIIRQDFQTLLTLYRSFYVAKQFVRADALLSDLNVYAQILGLNLSRVLNRNDLQHYFVQSPKTDNENPYPKTVKPYQPFDNPYHGTDKPYPNVALIRTNREFEENGFEKRTQNRTCPNCGELIKGRKNKIFCNDTCKSQYHKNNETTVSKNEGFC